MQHNTQVPVRKHNNRQHASPHHEVATDVEQMPIRPIIIIIITINKRLLTKSILQNAWLWLADTLASANHDQAFCWKLLVKNSCWSIWVWSLTLQWRLNGHECVSNHRLKIVYSTDYSDFRRRSKKTSKLRVTGLCAGNSPGTSEFPAQMASNTENVSIWWRHHKYGLWCLYAGVNRVIIGCSRSELNSLSIVWFTDLFYT